MTPKYRILPIGDGGVTPSGSLTITENGVYDVTHYEEVSIDANPSWLCFTALEDNSSVGITIVSSELYYTFDGVNSTRWYGDSITLNEGDKVYIFGKSGNSAKIGNFYMTGTISASGDITSLINGVGGTNNVTLNSRLFLSLFSGCRSLVKAPRIDMLNGSMLVGNNAGSDLFRNMFYRTGLTELPKLPHINREMGNTLHMFDRMFGMCTSLPAKPDLSYIDSSYSFPCEMYGMFEGSSIEELDLRGIANVSKSYQLKRTFRGMTNLTSVDLSNLTYISTSLNYVMEECFKDCVNLSTIKIAATSHWYQYNTYNWLNNVAQTGDFYNLGNNTTIPKNSPNGIPSNWVEHTSL